MKVLILFGGKSFEHDISCLSARNIYNSIDKEKYEVSLCGIDKNGIWKEYNGDINSIVNGFWTLNSDEIKDVISYLKDFNIVFPVIHGFPLESGDLLGLFNTFDIKFVGSDLESNTICYDKELTKLIVSNNGIDVTPYIVIHNINDIDNMDIEYPVIIKPSRCGSSIGIFKCNNYDELKNNLKESFKYDNKVLIEKFINAREFECGVLNGTPSIAGEILPHNEFYDFDSKYSLDSKEIIPANIDEDLKNKIMNTSKKIFEILNLKNIARIDYLYEKDNNILYFSEVNTMPGFTDISMYPKLFNYMGITNKELVDKLIIGK